MLLEALLRRAQFPLPIGGWGHRFVAAFELAVNVALTFARSRNSARPGLSCAAYQS
jgi:hypothetical protein